MQDRHADGHMTPQIDSQQNYELISLLESGGKTTMEFKRKFETCDPEDNAVQVNICPCTTSLNLNKLQSRARRSCLIKRWISQET